VIATINGQSYTSRALAQRLVQTRKVCSGKTTHRFNRPKDFFVYPIALFDRLPAVAIPLLPGDPDVPLNLQAVFDQASELGPYFREIEYGRDLIVPRLSTEKAQWVAGVLKTRGRRA
jgi:hypothetical protein